LVANLEIYVRDVSHEILIAWLGKFLNELHVTDQVTPYTFLGGHFNNNPVNVILHSVAGLRSGQFVSAYLHGVHLPWSSDADFGRHAAQDLELEVRCDPGSVAPYPGYFLRIVDGTESIVNWWAEDPLEPDDSDA
jgi:hypothetical protein